jgi:hypothetical protein
MNYRVTVGKRTVARFDYMLDAQFFVRVVTDAERYEASQVRIISRTGQLISGRA